MLQPAVAFLQEGLGLNRGRAVALLCGVGSLGTLLVVWFSKDLAAMDTLDFWVGTFCIYVLACVQTFIFGWVFGTKRGLEELDRGADLRVPRLFTFVIKYISPVYLLIVFVAWAWQDVGARLDDFSKSAAVRWSLLFLLALLLLFLWWIRLAVRRWNMEDRAS
jgi:SNF family Na+-dependent transporter